MMTLAGIAVLAAATALSQPVAHAVVNGEAIEVTLPADIFRNQQFSKYLASGLTTTVVVSADANERGFGKGEAVRVDIRYDLWDEIYRLTERDATGKQEQVTLPPARLNDWLSTTRFRVATAHEGQVPAMVRINVDVIPFSATEQAEAQRWLLHSMRTAEAQAEKAAGSTNAAPAVFDRMIAGSVQPKAVLSWHWKVSVTRP